MAYGYTGQMSDEPSKISDHQIAEIIDRVDKLAWKNDWSELTRIYAALDPAEMEIVEMIAYLRTPFTYRHKILTWEAFRDRAKVEIEAKGRDSNKLLRGLGS